MRKQKVFVALPSTKLGVFVSPAQASVLEYLIKAGSQGVTWRDIEQECGVRAANAVSRLRVCGAWIDTYPASQTVRHGVRRVGCARYVFRGWDSLAPANHADDFSKQEGLCRV